LIDLDSAERQEEKKVVISGADRLRMSYVKSGRNLVDHEVNSAPSNFRIVHVDSLLKLEQKIKAVGAMLRESPNVIMRDVELLLVALCDFEPSHFGEVIGEWWKNLEFLQLMTFRNVVVTTSRRDCKAVVGHITRLVSNEIGIEMAALEETKRFLVAEAVVNMWRQEEKGLNQVMDLAFSRQTSAVDRVKFALLLGTRTSLAYGIQRPESDAMLHDASLLERECFPDDAGKYLSSDDKMCVIVWFTYMYVKFREAVVPDPAPAPSPAPAPRAPKRVRRSSTKSKVREDAELIRQKEEILALTRKLFALYQDRVCEKITESLPWRVTLSRHGRADLSLSAILIRVAGVQRSIGNPQQNLLDYTVLFPGVAEGEHREMSGNDYLSQECHRRGVAVSTSFSSIASVEVTSNNWAKISTVIPLNVRGFCSEEEIEAFLANRVPVDPNEELVYIVSQYNKKKKQ